MTTFMLRKEDVNRNWYIIDAEDKNLGRVASKAATILRGKHKPTFTPHVDCGDYVIVINAEKIELTGDKWEDKLYHTYSGYRGGLKTRTAQELHDQFPERMIELAVKGMLPKGKLGDATYKKLFVYAGPEHQQQAQKPEVMVIKG